MSVKLPDNELWVHSREQLFLKLNELYDKGYRYITRDKDSEFIHCYSIKPKKYDEWEGWGYKNPNLPGVLMAYVIKNIDCQEIDWSNKTPLLIEKIIK